MSAIERFLYTHIRPHTERHPRIHALFRSAFTTLYRRSILCPEYRALRHIRALERYSKGRLPVTITEQGSYVEHEGIRFRVGELADGTYGAPPPSTVYEEEIYLQFIKQLHPIKTRRVTVVDIGANVGIIALRLAQDIGANRTTVYAIEPSRKTFAVLEDNLALNPTLDIKPLRLAISDHDGTVSLTSDGGTGNHLVSVGSTQSERVKASTFSTMKRNEHIDRIDGIKIDVEGAELLVLQGARDVLLRDRPIIMIEIQDEWTQRFGYHAIDVFTYLVDTGYTCQTENGKIVKDRAAFTRVAPTNYNFLFIPRDKL
jgi:FkbM family methyltransferase